MTIFTKRSLYILLMCSGLTNPLFAAVHYNKPQLATITAIDSKKRVIVLDREMYPMHKRIRVYSGRFPSINDLIRGQEVKFTTVKDQKTQRVEVREIWVVPR